MGERNVDACGLCGGSLAGRPKRKHNYYGYLCKRCYAVMKATTDRLQRMREVYKNAPEN